MLKKITPLNTSFYQKSTIDVAKNLLGTYLFHETTEGKTIGRIVETEAYLSNDPACHASRGETPRTQILFGPPGHAYIYFIYGMYYCFNVVTRPLGTGEGILIRALEPIEGIDLMQERRLKKSSRLHPFSIHELCNGPAKLVIALGIKSSQNGSSLIKGPLKILPATYALPKYKPLSLKEIVTTTRIGISQGIDLPLRFYIKGSPFVSKIEK